jgi:uncharacterized protein (TIGR04255 family)
MSPETPIRLDLERPPLVEQAISVIFERLPGFSIVDYGLFWQDISAELPNVAHLPTLDKSVEHFDEMVSSAHFQLVNSTPLPRGMFSNERGELVQLQPDRFGFNWAKQGDAPYPRSEPMMKRFEELYAQFVAFVKRRELGEIVLSQCELTNFNILPVAEFGSDFSAMSEALNVDPLDLGIPFLKAETYTRNRQHRIVDEDGTPLGRLHTTIEPVFAMLNGAKAFKLEFTARSAPNIRNLDGARRFFAVARNAVNGAFRGTVTKQMRDIWGERDGN